MFIRTRLHPPWSNQRWSNKPNLLLSFHHNSRDPLPDVISWNIRLTALAAKGELDAARRLFDEMPYRTVVSWNAMISGYTKWDRSQEGLLLSSHMHRSSTRLNETTLCSVLGLCARSGHHDLGRQFHCLLLKYGSENFELVSSSLLNLYTSRFEIHDAIRLFELLHCRNHLLWSLMLVGFVRCNMMGDAMNLFERMPARDVVSWTALISGYSSNAGDSSKALELFLRMRGRGEVKPNGFTYDAILRACANLGAFEFGKTIHCSLVKFGYISDRSVGGALIDFYSNCDAVEDAKRVFGQMDAPYLSTSNSMIENLVSAGRIDEAEMVFNQLVEQNPVSYNLMLKGYAQEGRIADAKALFEKMPCKNVVSLNTMISICHQNGEFEEARNLFDHIKMEKNTVTWNSMISGCVQNDQPVESLKLYAVMRRSSVDCSRSTFSALFRACASIGTIQQGRILHAHLSKTPFESNTYVGTSLVDMYSKCGSVKEARSSFLQIVSPNVASWTALINSLAHSGLEKEAIIEFGRMSKHGIDPNVVTFVGILTACGRAGLVHEGMKLFYSMQKKYGLIPTVEHYACVVDLLGRSGFLREAEQFILDMPIESDKLVWGALLNACWHCMDLELGERVAERMFNMDSKQISTYVAMSNIYAKIGRWQEVVKVRRRLRDMQVRKDPGCSWIEVKNIVHVFVVEDRSHPQRDHIYVALEELVASVNSYALFGDDVYCCQKDPH